MKLKLSFSLFLLAALFPAILLGQSGPNTNHNIKIATGSDMGGLIGDLSAVLNAAMEEETERPLTRARVVAPKRSVVTVRSASNASVAPLRSAATASVSPVGSIQQVEREVFSLINRRRAAQGMEALIWNEDVAKVARMHSNNMANYKFFSHRGLDGRMVNDRADSVGLNKWRGIGENIAFERGYDNPASFAVEKWMESPSHRQNLLGQSWKESAVGIAVAPDGSYYFTQVFLQRK